MYKHAAQRFPSHTPQAKKATLTKGYPKLRGSFIAISFSPCAYVNHLLENLYKRGDHQFSLDKLEEILFILLPTFHQISRLNPNILTDFVNTLFRSRFILCMVGHLMKQFFKHLYLPDIMSIKQT